MDICLKEIHECMNELTYSDRDYSQCNYFDVLFIY